MHFDWLSFGRQKGTTPGQQNDCWLMMGQVGLAACGWHHPESLRRAADRWPSCVGDWVGWGLENAKEAAEWVIKQKIHIEGNLSPEKTYGALRSFQLNSALSLRWFPSPSRAGATEMLVQIVPGDPWEVNVYKPVFEWVAWLERGQGGTPFIGLYVGLALGTITRLAKDVKILVFKVTVQNKHFNFWWISPQFSSRCLEGWRYHSK